MTRPDAERLTADEAPTFVELLRSRAASQPDRTAYVFLPQGDESEVSLTYAQIDERARAVAGQLLCRVKRGAHVLLVYPPGIEFIVAFFGCLYAGVAAVPTYPPRPNRSFERLRSIALDSGAELALTTSSLCGLFDSDAARERCSLNLAWLPTDRLDLSLASDWSDPGVSGDDLAFLQYTSGSTAEPKGVMVSHANLLHNERQITAAFGRTEASVGVGWLPLYHDMGLIGHVLQPLYTGSLSVLLSPLAFLQRPARWLEAISHFGAHTGGGPNFAYDLCVEKISEPARQTLDLSCWEVAYTGSEPVRAGTLERFAAAFSSCGFKPKAFFACYGLAEATLFATGGDHQAPPVVRTFDTRGLEFNEAIPAIAGLEGGRQFVGCGHSWHGQQVVIVDPTSHSRLPDGQIGEIWIAGESVTRGYWNKPVETQATFRATLSDTGEGRFLRTGDLGFIHENELFVAGRSKDLLIIRGRNYHPQDIELTAERSHEFLRLGGAAAFAVELDDEEQLVILNEVGREALGGNSLALVAERVRESVACTHEVQPHAVHLVPPLTIPRTSSGKIQRRLCRALYLAGQLSILFSDRPSTIILSNKNTLVTP